MAVHARPAAFDGPDGLPYSVDIVVDETDDAARPFAAFLLFLRWRRMGPSGIDASLESEYVAHGESEAAARDAAGALPLHHVKALLDALVRAAAPPGGLGASGRKWYEAMRDEGTAHDDGRDGDRDDGRSDA
jgi:hypothetical protein